jgi:glycosyltransferase involved in cell wall biosynthesis
MKISCLIAAYNAGNYVGKALHSIAAQSHSDWEVIVVEDGSHDQTEDIVKEFAGKVGQSVRYHNLGQNRGVASARNQLLDLAGGEAVAFLDADDWWSPSHLANAHQRIRDGADVVVARVQLFELKSGASMGVYYPSNELMQEPVATLFDRSEVITSSCVSLARSIVEKTGRFDPLFRIGEDRDYWMRCALNGARFADSGEITCHYAKHATSTMGKTLLWAQQDVAFYRKHRSLAAVPAGLRRSKLSEMLANYGRLSRASDPRASCEALAEAWKLRPFSLGTALQYGNSLLRSRRTT